MRTTSQLIISLMMMACAFVMVGCDDDDTDTDVSSTTSALFAPSVKGLAYVSGNELGVTDDQSRFTHETGQAVRFGVGGIVLGEAPGKPTMTPVDLVVGATDETHPTVSNITRFLLTIDDDGNPDNGVSITQAVRLDAAEDGINFAQSVADFEGDVAVQRVVARLTALTSAGERPLFPRAEAEARLRDALKDLRAPD